MTTFPPQTGKTIPKWKAKKLQEAKATASTSRLPVPTEKPIVPLTTRRITTLQPCKHYLILLYIV